jgi:hypothetical protein
MQRECIGDNLKHLPALDALFGLAFKNQHPDHCAHCLQIIQTCARNIFGAGSKERGDTPIDSLIIEIDDATSCGYKNTTGGVVDKIHAAVNEYLVPRSIVLSRSCVHSMFHDAKVQFLKSKNTKTSPRLDQHYCAGTLKYVDSIYLLFSDCDDDELESTVLDDDDQ